MNRRLQFFLVITFMFAARVSAQTLYVDATNGNDLWTGSLPDAQASDGPWRSLAKVSATSLQPGDSVLLKCGAIWHEPLVVPSSGAAGNPITFSNYGANCDASTKPVINGAGPLSGWSVSSGNIYTTQNTLAVVQQNRVVNGRFDLNLTSWSFWFPPQDPSPASWVRQDSCIAPGNACAKLTGSSGGSGGASLATSNSFTISQGKGYRAKFWLKGELASQNVTVMVRRNGRLINGIKNYDTVGLNQPIIVGTAWQAYEYTFTATSTESQTARIDFQVNAGQTLYIDNVEVMQITSEIADIHQVFVDGIYVKLAQHPNPRSVDPTDTYLAISAEPSE